MKAGTVETAREGRGNGQGLRRSPMNAPTQGILGGTMPRKRSDPVALRQEKWLPISESAVESSERPTAVVSQGPSGNPGWKETR